MIMTDIVDKLVGLGAEKSTKRTPRSAKRGARIKSSPAVSSMNASLERTKELKEKLQAAQEENEQLKLKTVEIEETGPVSQKTIKIRIEYVNPDLIDISSENGRIQDLLTHRSVDDIIESIKKDGQNQPGVLRPKAGGRYELIDGSRRLFAVKQIKGREYLAKIGAYPDEDVRVLSDNLNIGLAISDYEKGMQYLLQKGEFGSEIRLLAHYAEKENVSRETIRIRIKIAELPEWYVALYKRPNDIATTGISKLTGLLKNHKNSLLIKSKCEEIKEDLIRSYEKEKDWPSHSKIISRIVGLIEEPSKKEQQNDPMTYKDKHGKTLFTYQRKNNGNSQINLIDPSKADETKILKLLEGVFK